MLKKHKRMPAMGLLISGFPHLDFISDFGPRISDTGVPNLLRGLRCFGDTHGYTTDQGIGRIQDHPIRRIDAIKNLDGWAEVATHRDVPQLDLPFRVNYTDLQPFRAEEQRIGRK